MPSRTVETFSIAALEAMAMARPMLMTDIGGARELVRPGETGWLVAPGDVQALGTTLQRLADPAMRPTLHTTGRLAQRLVSDRFTVERMTQGYEQAFEHLLRPGSPVAGVSSGLRPRAAAPR
jgi:glycosyltransferase involved in cell wall biosynthesis